MYDFTYLSLGGGVQSTAIAEMMVIGELPRVDLVVFADTGDEPHPVYDHIRYLFSRLQSVGIECAIAEKGNIIEDMYKEDRFNSLPLYVPSNTKKGRGQLRRQCTSEYKIRPIIQEVKDRLIARDLAKVYCDGRKYVHRSTRVMCYLGISTDEAERMKDSPYPWCEYQYPLIDLRMSRKDCKTWLTHHDLPVPMKSSCRVCPFHNDKYWDMMKRERPDDWDHIVKFDHWLRDGSPLSRDNERLPYLHTDLVPIDQVEFKVGPQWEQLEMFDACDSGYCFI